MSDMTAPHNPRTLAAEALLWARQNPPPHLDSYAAAVLIHASRYAMNIAGGTGRHKGMHELAAAWWEASNLLTQAAMRNMHRLRRVAATSTCTYHGGCNRPADSPRDEDRCEDHQRGTRWAG